LGHQWDFFLDQIEVVLPVLGLDVLQPILSVAAGPVSSTQSTPDRAAPTDVMHFAFEIGVAKAKAVESNGEFIVKAQSLARAEVTPSMPPTYRALRQQLTADGALQPKDSQTLVFARDVPFTSPTAAACVVYGASISGPGNWYVEGTSQTYAEIRQRALQAAEAAVE